MKLKALIYNELKEKDMNEMKENENNKQNSAVNDSGKIWEELQTAKKVSHKLYLERQHLEMTLNHALTIINNNENSEESDRKESIDKNKNEVVFRFDAGIKLYQGKLNVRNIINHLYDSVGIFYLSSLGRFFFFFFFF